MNSNMNIGKTRRLTKIFQTDGHTVIVPMDHGVSVGPIKGIENMQATVNRLNQGAVDAVVLHKGLAKRVDVGKAGLIVHLSAISNLTPNCNNKVQVCTVLEALRLGADAVSVHVNVGAEHEHKMLSVLGEVADECDLYGVPLLAMMYPRGPNIKNEHDTEAVAHAARLGAELGADIIKTNYTGTVDSFRAVTEGCPVPVIIAGGPKAKTTEDVLQTTYESMQAGAAGLSIGRNVFQHENPAAIVKALCAIVHQSATVAQVKKLLGEA
jgi:fructose-bisphosphate aldolase / 2-amino-3,7-dideoxy-D-threo-hept-6-ulosonate synthase